MLYNKEIRSRIIKKVNGIDMKILETKVEKKDNNTILLLHGFPEISYSFRHLMSLLAKSGYYCVAPDQRGYGASSKLTTASLNEYSIINLTKDISYLLKKLCIKKIHLIGHDFGAYVSSYFTLLHPDNLLSLTLMSMPFSGPVKKKNIDQLKKLNVKLRHLKEKRKHYQCYFSKKNAAINILNCKQGLTNFFRGYFYFKSYDYKLNRPFKLNSISAKEMAKMPEYYIMKYHLGMAQTIERFMPSKNEINKCKWLTNNDLRVYVNYFRKYGLENPLYWYKVMLSKKEKNKIIKLELPKYTNVPSIYLSGEADWGTFQKPGEKEKMESIFFNNFFGTKLIKKAGHWVQQEQPFMTYNTIMKFYKKI